MRAWTPLVIVLGCLGAGLAQPRADATRNARAIDDALTFLPRGATLRVAASGFEEPIADALWVRAVLLFGERVDRDRTGAWRAWLVGMIEAISELDPRWRSVYHYGGAMLRVVGEIEASSGVFRECAAQLPDDGWCHFSLGMNYYLYDRNLVEAQAWMQKAAATPGAPGWWSAAAARMSSQAGAMEAALEYIDSQIAEARSEAELGYLGVQRRRLVHDMLVERWAGACREFRESTGAPLASPDALPSLGFELPENPRGDEWVVGADGVVRSMAAEGERARRAKSAERALAVPR